MKFAPRVTRNGKFQRADAHNVQSLRIVEAQKAHRHAAITGKFRSDGGHVPARALNAAAKGRVVNLAAAAGHPASVMDLSFAAQALAVAGIAGGAIGREPGVHPVAASVDQEVARLKLASLGIEIDVLSDAQESYLRPFR